MSCRISTFSQFSRRISARASTSARRDPDPADGFTAITTSEQRRGSWRKNWSTGAMLKFEASCGRSHHGFTCFRSETKQTPNRTICQRQRRFLLPAQISRRNLWSIRQLSTKLRSWQKLSKLRRTPCFRGPPVTRKCGHGTEDRGGSDGYCGVVALPLAITAHQIVFGTSEPPTFSSAHVLSGRPVRVSLLHSTSGRQFGYLRTPAPARPKSWRYQLLTPS